MTRDKWELLKKLADHLHDDNKQLVILTGNGIKDLPLWVINRCIIIEIKEETD